MGVWLFKKLKRYIRDDDESIYIHISCGANRSKILNEGLHEDGIIRIGDTESKKYKKYKNKYLLLKK